MGVGANLQRASVSRNGKSFQDALIAKIKQPGWVEKHLEQTADGPVLRSDHRAYAYDPIGNRTSSEDWDRATGENRITTYESNPLNQYDEQITGNGVTGTFEHDEDGNLVLTSMEGRDTVYAYDGENRLSTVEPAAPGTGSQKIAFLYDYMDRRVQKAVYGYSAGEWQLEKEILFVYDGWNLIEEITVVNATETSRYFVWGLDLSQSFQGTGGVGGLLAVVDGENVYQYCFDGNGNVGQLVDAATGAVAAHYEFDPFGNITYSSGSYAGDNSFIFSTKYQDAETGLIYYGYRYYSSSLGRWINRDPLIEAGAKILASGSNRDDYERLQFLVDSFKLSLDLDGYQSDGGSGLYDLNTILLYIFVQNNSVNYFDPDGRKVSVAWTGPHPTIIIENPNPRISGQWGFGPAPFQNKTQKAKWAVGMLVPGVVVSGTPPEGVTSAPQVIYESDCLDQTIYNNIVKSMMDPPDYSYLQYNCIDWLNDMLYTY